MQQTWRWFGPNDSVKIDDMLQAGVQGVVSSLYECAPGETWSLDAIKKHQSQIGTMSDGGLSHLEWEVVESLPVSENIKRQTGNYKEHLANYRQSLTNLSESGVKVVCYNFMPVLDWTRTDLLHRLPNGATCMRFDYLDFAVFDIEILQRQGAADDYPEELLAMVEQRFSNLTDAAKVQLSNNVVTGLPGAAQSMSLQDVREYLSVYGSISADQLRANLFDFLAEVVPHAQNLGMRLCCHPDDPPYPLLGLPRIMSTESDYTALLAAVNMTANGITLCSGSLGARADNDLPGMMQRLGDRVHFLHLRNVKRESQANFGSFHEAEHLHGDTDMVSLIAAVLNEERKRQKAGRHDVSIPFRPDHGQNILDDHTRATQPGYPAIGRLKGLAELRGIAFALNHQFNEVVA